MNVDRQACADFWRAYVEQLPMDDPHRQRVPDAFGFGGDPHLADELAALVLLGRKRATTSLPIEYTALGQALPQVGDVSIIVRGDGLPAAVIERTQVSMRAFDEVDAEYAAIEGEGDGSLSYWRAAHRDYFQRVGAHMNLRFFDSTPVLCQIFDVIWPCGVAAER